MDREKTVAVAQPIDRRRAAHDRDRFHSLRHHPAAGVGVRRPAGNREDPEAFDPEPVGELAQQRRPIEQPPFGSKLRIANAGPIRRDDAHPEIARRVIRQLRHRPRAGPAVAKEDRRAAADRRIR